jgi:hypothetical protein
LRANEIDVWHNSFLSGYAELLTLIQRPPRTSVSAVFQAGALAGEAVVHCGKPGPNPVIHGATAQKPRFAAFDRSLPQKDAGSGCGALLRQASSVHQLTNGPIGRALIASTASTMFSPSTIPEFSWMNEFVLLITGFVSFALKTFFGSHL